MITTQQREMRRLIASLAKHIGSHPSEFAGMYWRQVKDIARQYGLRCVSSVAIADTACIQYPVV
jgi:hypothetical protein